MIDFFKWLNRLPFFDTTQWPNKEFLIRSICVLFVLYYLWLQVPVYQQHGLAVRDASRHLETMQASSAGTQARWMLVYTVLIFLLLIVRDLIIFSYLLIYLMRMHARSHARTFMETVYPFIIACIPFLFASGGSSISRLSESFTVLISLHLSLLLKMLFGSLLSVICMWSLGKSFALMVEARDLKRHGVFSRIRHPLYLSHFITFAAICLLNLTWRHALVFGIYVAGQVIRARMEERKLLETYPEYTEYQAMTGMFFPKFKS